MKKIDVYKTVKGLLTKVQGISRTQAIIASVVGVVAVGGVGTGGYLIYGHNHQTQEVIAEIVVDTEDSGDKENIVADTELLAVESVEETEETETAEVEAKELTLVGTSIEKDLKIKIQDQSSGLVSGEEFEVSVKSEKKGATATTYTDDDKDGIIYIDKLEAGNYTVDLKEIEGYEIKKGSITVKVKDQIEYEQVDVTAEIKTESEVNAAVEDTAVNNVPVESTVTDTVALLESTVTASTVAKSDVDQSNFTHAVASSERVSETLTKTITLVEDTETETPEATETESPSTETETPEETENQSTETETTEGTEAVEGTETASVERNHVSRVTTASTSAVTATVSLPKTVTLYNCDNSESSSYALTLAISGDSSIIKSVTWASTNAEIVALSATSGTSVTISRGSSGGTGSVNIGATVTYYTDDAGTTATKLITTTVTVSNFTDSSTVLKDKSGNVLYTDSSATSVATLKDYSTYSVFYTTPQYTGWQTIDGKVYYYNADHVALTGTQVIGGITYTFASDGSLSQSSGSRGIDVSKWQGSIDWGAVASSGISFAIIRAGYRGASTGALIEDPYFKQNIYGATRAGIKVGVYFFTQAISEAEAIEEASMVLSLISGYTVSYPIFIDTESATNGRANGLDKSTRTAVVNAFCQTIANAGYQAGVYASKNWYINNLNASSLSNFCIWVAQYNSSCTYSGKYDMWQYTSSGSVSGINGNVDMNISFM